MGTTLATAGGSTPSAVAIFSRFFIPLRQFTSLYSKGASLGRISLENCVTVSVPFFGSAPSGLSAMQLRNVSLTVAGHPGNHMRKVLIVEGDLVKATALRRGLVAEGYEVLWARDAQTGVRLAA